MLPIYGTSTRLAADLAYLLNAYNDHLGFKKVTRSAAKRVEVPYIGSISNNFIKILKSDLKSNDVQFYHRSINLGNLITFKSNNVCSDKLEMMNVIYLFTCVACDDIKYVGMTERKLSERIKEHKCSKSPVGAHLLGCKACAEANWNDRFKIIGKCDDWKGLRILEALKIQQIKPYLNNQLAGEGAKFSLRIT